MIIFGIRSYLRKNSLQANLKCIVCQHEPILISSLISYFHIWFIPVFATGNKKIITCTHCGHSKDSALGTKEEKEFVSSPKLNKLLGTPWWAFSFLFLIFGIYLLFMISAGISVVLMR